MNAYKRLSHYRLSLWRIHDVASRAGPLWVLLVFCVSYLLPGVLRDYPRSRLPVRYSPGAGNVRLIPRQSVEGSDIILIGLVLGLPKRHAY